MTRTILTIIFLLFLLPVTLAQRKFPKPKYDPKKSAEEQKALAQKAAASRTNLIEATKTYKDSLEKLLLPLGEREKIVKDSLEKKRQMVEQGLIAKRELEPIEIELKAIQSKIADTKKSMTQADQFIVEIMSLEQMAKDQANRKYQAPGMYFDNLRYIRYTGTVRWSLRDYGRVEGFFQANFRHALPVSAFGQSETHNRLGFDHSNSFDVALHPDTGEAQTLMSYLRNQGIPFTAFRGPIPGNATGAHIHIGYPSHRFR